MKNFYVILIVVSVVAGLALGYGIWGKDKANLEKLQKTLEEKEVSYSRTLAESEELRNFSKELRGKISGLETDNNEFKDILKKIDELIEAKIGRAPAPAEDVSTEAAPPTDVAPAEAAPIDVAPAKAAPADAAPDDVAPTDVAPAKAAPTEAVPEDVAPTDVAPAKAAPDDVAPVAPVPAVPTIEPAHKGVSAAPEGSVTMPAAPDESSPGLQEVPEAGGEAEVEGKEEKTEEAPTLAPVPELKSEHIQDEEAI